MLNTSTTDDQIIDSGAILYQINQSFEDYQKHLEVSSQNLRLVINFTPEKKLDELLDFFKTLL